MATLKEAKRQGVKVALSKPCFELWLLLHHFQETQVTQLANASAVERALKDHLGAYNKTNLRVEHFPLKLLPKAIARAAALDIESEIPTANVTRVYRLCQAIEQSTVPQTR